jgi:hypothetical protein
VKTGISGTASAVLMPETTAKIATCVTPDIHPPAADTVGIESGIRAATAIARAEATPPQTEKTVVSEKSPPNAAATHTDLSAAT